jgi:CRP/FNR family transcriptional regulator
MEGQPARGVYLLCSGRAKLSTCSEEGRAVILRIASIGELLGLNAVVSGATYEKTAQAMDECRIGYIKNQDFFDFIREYPDGALNALKQLSSNYNQAFLQICSLGLSASVGDKLARLLLQWCDRFGQDSPIHIKRTHTHGEIAEMIGTSRETVTRLLTDFRERSLISLSKTEICIPDKKRLKAAIGGKHRNGHCDV